MVHHLQGRLSQCYSIVCSATKFRRFEVHLRVKVQVLDLDVLASIWVSRKERMRV